MKVKKEIHCSFKELPFNSSLSFGVLINELTTISKDKSNSFRASAKEVLDKIEKAPELKGSITDQDLIKKHQDLIDQMMGFVFSPTDDQYSICSATSPMTMDPFYTNNGYKTILGAKNATLDLSVQLVEKQLFFSLIYQAYMIVLNKLYGVTMDNNTPFTMKLTNNDDNSVKYFNKQFNLKYLEVIPKGKIKKMTQEEIKDLFDHTQDLDYWNEKLPLKNFEFSGFIQANYFNVTRDHLISELKSDMLNKSTFISNDSFVTIRDKIRALVENPDIDFGFALIRDLDAQSCDDTILKSIIPHGEFELEDYEGTVFSDAIEGEGLIFTEDFEKLGDNKIARSYLDKGIHCHVIIPLKVEEELVGLIELGTPKANGINMFQVLRLAELFPVFALAAKRANDEWSDKVRAVIQKKFTAIHPTVEWRFRESVANIIGNEEVNESATIDPIVFSDIVPIYGASDIRGSSIERSKSVQADLAEQLNLAREILANHEQRNEMPLLNDLSFKIEQNANIVDSGLNAGDEFSVVDFLKREVNPMFVLLADRYPDSKKPIENYFEKLDPELGILYKMRKNFEDSLTMINNQVSEIIDEEQERAQEIFPHYFEKYRTDGIEYNAYIGQSLVQNLKYSDIYLRNIRLWQLLVKVKVARSIKVLQPELPTKLDITQLILVHSSPFSIEFRQDEKKFDVAGAYNIRYEITKKRIDKAYVKGTKERVTQVGKIAIIYSHADEIEEYRDYIRFMMAQGYLTNNIEELELEDLKGASGLKALRLEIDFSDLSPIEINPQEIGE